MIKVEKQVFRNVIDVNNPNAALQSTIGMMKGDIIVFRGDNDPVRLPIGTDGQVLTVDSTTETGLKWVTP